MQDLIPVNQAASLILSQLSSTPSECIKLSDAQGRFLRSPILSDRPLPPFNRVMMDGIAICHNSWSLGNKQFHIAGTQAAGAPPVKLKKNNSCIEVMTGGVLPDGCDCVIPVEEINLSKTPKSATIRENYTPKINQHIHSVGSDTPKDNILVPAGTCLFTPELTIAASCGFTKLKVASLPRITIISTGDELVAPEETPEPYQIRRSHATALRASIESHKRGLVSEKHVTDDPAELEKTLRSALAENDILILTGGVSRGKFDYVAPVLKKLLGTPAFHGVAQRPGKPFAFWPRTSSSSTVFALPGNPCSVMACAARYLFPALHQMLSGTPYLPNTLPATGQFNCPPSFTGLISCKIKNGALQLLPPSNSGNFLALAGTHGIAELPGKLTRTNIANYPASFYPW